MNACNPIIRKVSKLGNSLALVIPTEILKAYAIQRGDLLVFVCLNDQFFSVRKIPDRLLTNLKEDIIKA